MLAAILDFVEETEVVGRGSETQLQVQELIVYNSSLWSL